MAGKKKKDELKGEAKKGSILPKTIAGVKLPKDVRNRLTDLAKHPVVADLLAAGLVALAARIKNEPQGEGTQKAVKKPDNAVDALAELAGEAVAVVTAAVTKRPAAKAKDAPAAETAAETPTPAPKPATRRKPAAKPAATATPAPAPKAPRKSAEKAPPKPRAARRPTPKAPKPPKPSA